MMKKKCITVFLIIALLWMVFSFEASYGEEPVGISIRGPPAVGVSKNATYEVFVSGGPAAESPNGTYSVKAWILGERVETAKPLASSPFNETSKDGKFKVNITAPDHTGKITLIVEATSRSENETQSQAKKELEIFVVNPITIDVTVRNNGETSAKNVILYLYLDGDLVANKTIPELPAKNTTNITLEYAPPSLTPGRHVIRIVIDPRFTLVEFEEGNNVIEREFYLYTPEPDTLPFLIAILVATSIAVVVVFWRASKKKEKLKELE